MRELTVSEAYDQLRRAQKTSYGAPAYSRWVNRPAGRGLAAVAYRAGLTPNQVTAASAAFTYLAIACLALIPPSAGLGLAVAGLLLVGYALDSADGQLARLTHSGRPSGEWLDHVVDMGKICLLNGAVAVSWFRWGVPGWQPGPWQVALPVLSLTVAVVSFFGWLLADLLVRASGRPVPPRAGQAGAPVSRSLLRLPSDYGLFALCFAWFATSWFMPTYGLLLAVNALILVAALPTWFQQVRACEVPS